MVQRPRSNRQDQAGQVMTVDQVAAYLQLNRLTVYRYVREGKIPAAKIGKVYRILRADVDRFLESMKVPAKTIPSSPRGSLPEARVKSVWVRDIKSPREIYVGSGERKHLRDLDPLILTGDPLEVIIRGLH